MTNVEHSTALARIQGWVGLGSFYEIMEHVQPNILLMLQRILIESQFSINSIEPGHGPIVKTKDVKSLKKTLLTSALEAKPLNPDE